MKKKGFTLMELLAVIVILGVVSLVVFPVVNRTLKNTKEKSYQQQLVHLREAGENWATENYKELDREHVNDVYVPISMLKDFGYLSKDKLLNPKTKEEMIGCIYIHYDNSVSGYRYEYQEYTGLEIKNTCHVTTKGYVYQYTTEWVKNTDHAAMSAIEMVLANNPLAAVGSGLYEDNGRYIFRGSDVNNYVTIGTDVWRIVSMDKVARTLQLVRENYAYNSFWDNGTNIEFAGSKDASGTVVPSNALTQLNTYYESTSSSINTITNNVKFRDYIIGSLWNVGSINEAGSDIDTVRSKEKSKQMTSNLGLLTLSDYMTASLDEACNQNFNNSCKLNNYLYNMMASSVSWGGSWLLNNNGSDKIWYVKTDGTVDTALPNSATYGLFPVMIIKNSVTIQTDGQGAIGSKTNPYHFS